MQYLVFNSAIAALLAIGLALFSHFFQVPALRKSGQFMVIAVYGLAAWAVTYYRIFDIRQILVSLFQRVGVVVILGLGVFFGWKAIGSFLPQSVALMLSIGIFCSTCFWLDRRSREWLEIDGEHALSDMRQAVINIARAEPNTEKLGHEFERFLSEECNVPAAKLLFNQGKAYVAGNLEFPKARPGCVALCESGWATPESLTRRRATSGLTDLQLFFTNHSLGVMVASPRGSLSPSLILALKVKANEWPFTYPEVQRLQNVAELMDNILTHSRLTMQAAVQAKMEHLAMMSRGLAHDLNNLITPISSFLLHTDKGISPHSPEHEVHEAATRSVRVMTDYIREALFFSDRLSAKYETVDLSRILLDVYALTAARAAERGVVVKGVSDYNGKFTADAVLLQRLLVNLVGNAIDASNSGHKVTLSAALDRAGWLVLRVADEGSGISAENLERVFDPYFTTKRYGDNVRGFGLGLTICQKIVHLHGGTISVSSQPGHGTTVTIDIPLEQGGQTPEIGGPAR